METTINAEMPRLKAGGSVEAHHEIGPLGSTIFCHLFTDLDLALSLLKTARVMPTGKSKTFYEVQAVKVYRDVSQKLANLHMSSDTRQTLSEKLLSVSAELLTLGISAGSALQEQIAS